MRIRGLLKMLGNTMLKTTVPKLRVGRAGTARRADVRQGADHHEERVLQMLPLVRHVAAKIRSKLPPHIEYDDMVSAGCIGLLNACNKFDARRRVKFSTYARHRIRGAILDELRGMDYASRHMRRQLKGVEEAVQSLELRLGRAVSEAEVAAELGMTVEAWHETNKRLQPVRALSSLQEDGKSHGGSNLENFADPNADPYEECYWSQVRQILTRACATLSPRQQFILAQYYDRFLTQREIGTALGLDESRIAQLRSNALDRLRERVRDALHVQAGGPQGPRGNRRTRPATAF